MRNGVLGACDRAEALDGGKILGRCAAEDADHPGVDSTGLAIQRQYVTLRKTATADGAGARGEIDLELTTAHEADLRQLSRVEAGLALGVLPRAADARSPGQSRGLCASVVSLRRGRASRGAACVR